MTNNEREAFERFMSEELGKDITLYEPGIYDFEYMNEAYRIWQAAKADSSPKLSEEDAAKIINDVIWGEEHDFIDDSRLAIKALAAAGVEFKK